MKNSVVLIIVIFSFIIETKAQGDALIITHKNGTIDTVLLSSIKKVIVTNSDSTSGNPENKDIKILNNAPNPVRDWTAFVFSLTKPGDVKISILDINGRVIRTISSLACPEGINSINWDCTSDDGAKVNSGFYFFELRFNNSKQFSKLLIIN